MPSRSRPDYPSSALRAPRRLLIPLACFALVAPVAARAGGADEARQLFALHCARCHGTDGAGTGATVHPATRPMNFRNCRVASGEPAAEWLVAVHDGGRAVGRSHEMPAFGNRLSPPQIRALVRYLRSFCLDAGWPDGDLNFPRPMITDKAFPEDEIVLTPSLSNASASAGRALDIETEIEKRVGRRSMVEIELPAQMAATSGKHLAGVGDVTLGFKNVLIADRAATHIVSAGIEVTFPSAFGANDLGHHTTLFEPFVAAGLRHGATYVQALAGLEVPARSPWADREIEYGVYIGRDLAERPTRWTVGAELTGENRDLALTPQVRRDLTRTGALAAAIGVSIPMNGREDRSTRWLGYLIWDVAEPVRARK